MATSNDQEGKGKDAQENRAHEPNASTAIAKIKRFPSMNSADDLSGFPGDWLPLEDNLLPGGRRPSYRMLKVWGLVLASRGVPHRLVPGEEGWSLQVPQKSSEAALHELHLFLLENRDWPPRPTPGSPRDPSVWETGSILMLLAVFHNVVSGHLRIPFLGYPEWLTVGCVDAVAMLGGEWWRGITALTLHADWRHLLGNLFFGGGFILLLSRRLGSGVAWLMVLSGGWAGNMVNALLQEGHRSIGASTSVFAALGLLSGMTAWVEHRRVQRWALPLGSGVAMLALFGAGDGFEGKVDVGAHLFGFLWGLGLSPLGVRIWLGNDSVAGRMRRTGSWLAWGVLLGSWYLALTSGRN